VHGVPTPAGAETPLIAFEQVSRRFRARGDVEIAALSDVTFDVARGEIFGVIGRSGAGKSTLLRMINGLDRPDQGRVVVDGAEVSSLGEPGLVALRRRIGMIFQGFNLMSSRNVRDNVALPLRLAGSSQRKARARADEALELVGLSDKADAYPAKLSGGQKQRAGIARALATRPQVLLSDEATSALDPETTRSILALIRDINRRLGLTTVLITHEMEVVRAVADSVAVLDRGRLVEIGPVWRVFGRPSHDATRALVAEAAPVALTAAAGDVIFSLQFDGVDAGEPDLSAIIAALGPGARLIESAVARVQGRAQGRLALAVARAGFDAPAALARLRPLAARVEIVEGARSDARQSV
jgi:D-methionine transport system ATP-binding protein